MLADLLDVVDNLDRAIDAARSNAGRRPIDTLLQGVEMVRQQFLAKLEGFGVKRIESAGQPVRSGAARSHHHAVPAASPDQDGRVVGVVRARLPDRRRGAATGVGGRGEELRSIGLSDHSFIAAFPLVILEVQRVRREHPLANLRIGRVPAPHQSPDDAIQPLGRRGVRHVETHAQRFERRVAGGPAMSRQLRVLLEQRLRRLDRGVGRGVRRAS